MVNSFKASPLISGSNSSLNSISSTRKNRMGKPGELNMSLQGVKNSTSVFTTARRAIKYSYGLLKELLYSIYSLFFIFKKKKIGSVFYTKDNNPSLIRNKSLQPSRIFGDSFIKPTENHSLINSYRKNRSLSTSSTSIEPHSSRNSLSTNSTLVNSTLDSSTTDSSYSTDSLNSDRSQLLDEKQLDSIQRLINTDDDIQNQMNNLEQNFESLVRETFSQINRNSLPIQSNTANDDQEINTFTSTVNLHSPYFPKGNLIKPQPYDDDLGTISEEPLNEDLDELDFDKLEQEFEEKQTSDIPDLLSVFEQEKQEINTDDLELEEDNNPILFELTQTIDTMKNKKILIDANQEIQSNVDSDEEFFIGQLDKLRRAFDSDENGF